ncbi:phosphotransferase [Patescibacteria group bacterium]|nr:phosphotransferase [Patescibacteria group bacterium]
MKTSEFQKRIGYEGELEKVVGKVAEDFSLGEYLRYRVIESGYEDLNVVITTDNGKYFIKMLATFRDNKGCKRYVDIMHTALEAGVSHPRLLRSSKGYLYVNNFDGTEIRLVVMEHIDGKTLYDSREKVSFEDARFLVQQAALINKINLQVPFVYDSWAVVNFLKEWKENKEAFPENDKVLIGPLFNKFSKLDVKFLPTAFVHGDIIRTNVMRDENGELYILDFSVANNYPRIQELAVLLCNLLYDDKNPGDFMGYYELALDEYKKRNELTKLEVKSLPLYLKAAHAMHIIGAGKEKYKEDNKSEENEYWLSQGRKGLRDMNKLFK